MSTMLERRYRRQHLNCVRHITLDPKGRGVVRIHMIPPREDAENAPFLLLLNGSKLVPLNLSWAILLSCFMDRLEPFAGLEITESDWNAMAAGAVAQTSEEMKMQNEGRKIMHLPELKVSCTCVRVPVVRSHSVSIVVRTKEKISVERARELIAAAPGCRLVDDLANKRYPMPLETSDQDLVFVGRIRDDLTSDNGLNIWCCGDQVRKGAATNAVQIAQLLIAE